MPIIYMLIGLLVAFFVYNHAKQRGHGDIIAFLWAAGSALMPVVLVPVYFLLGGCKAKPNQEYGHDIIDIEATVIEEEVLTCPKCGNCIKDDFIVCPYCQIPLNQSGKEH